MANPVTIHTGSCLNYRYTRMKCRLCREVCGYIKHEDEILGTKCSACGLCIAKCPASAVAIENYSKSQFEKLFAEQGAVILICRKHNTESPWPCLGFLNERLLLALAFSTGSSARSITIHDLQCPGCDMAVAEHLATVIDQTNSVLRVSGRKPIAVSSAGAQIDIRPKGVSRREFFSQLFGAAVITMREVVAPELGPANPLTADSWFDEYARSHLTKTSSVVQHVFQTKTVADSCDGCGICAGICHKKALRFELRQNTLELSHDPLACVTCGVCEEHCPHKAITSTITQTFETRIIHAVELPKCRDCGKHFQPVGGHSTCMDCLLKAKIQVLW